MPGAQKPLGARFFSLISRVARELEVDLGEGSLRGLVAWLELVSSWNAKIDLTAARGIDELVDLMVADGLLLSKYQDENSRLVDIGSGAGGPGLAIGLCRTDLSVTLVEPLQKRVSFLRTVVGQLEDGLAPSRIRIVREKGEATAARGAPFDAAVSRATFAPAEWLELGQRLIAPQGSVWVLLARDAPPKLAGFQVTHDETYQWPLTGAARRAVRYQRVATDHGRP